MQWEFVQLPLVHSMWSGHDSVLSHTRQFLLNKIVFAESVVVVAENRLVLRREVGPVPQRTGQVHGTRLPRFFLY
jgi:hypothetical protein